MFSLKSTKSYLCLLLLITMLILIGCSNDEAKLGEEKSHGLTLAFDIPEELLADVTALTVVEQVTVNSAEIRVYQDGEFVLIKTLRDPLENNEVVLADLDAGREYQVKVDLLGTLRAGSEEQVLYQGQGLSGEIKADTLTALDIELEPLRAQSLEISEISINNFDATVDNVTLQQNSENSFTKDYTPGVRFEDGEDGLELTPARWELIVELSDGNKREEEILLLPTEEKNKSISFNMPVKPSGLALNDSYNLVWEQDDYADFYLLYKSEDNDPSSLGRASVQLDDNIYRGVEDGYYYWVRAYNQAYDYKSELSNSYYVDEGPISKYEFSSSESKEINLGDVDSAIVAITPLDIVGSRSPGTYDATLDVTFADGSNNSNVSVNEITQSQQEAQLCPQAETDAEMRRLEDMYLEMDLEPANAQASDDYQASQYSSYQIGESRSFYNRHDDSIDSTLKAIGDKALVYVADDIKNDLEIGTLEEIASQFDDTIYPNVMDNFAFHDVSEYDWDGNGKTIIFIYDMGGSTSGFTAGYFHGKDYWEQHQSSQESNEADMFYINYFALDLADDPGYSYSLDDVLSTIAHEFQHLLFFVNKQKAGRSGEDIWINEGFSQLAEYLTGYYAHDDDSRISGHYFGDPEGTSLMGWEQELKDYGVTSLFALYLYERFGVEIIEAIHTSDKFTEEIIADMGDDFAEVVLAWAISNYIDEQGLEGYSYQGTNLSNEPEITTIDGSVSNNFSLKSTAVKYFKIEANGSDVNLEIDLSEDTGVVIYK